MVHLLDLPPSILVHIFRFWEAATVYSVMFLNADQDGEPVLTITCLERGSYLALSVCFSTTAPLVFEVVSICRRVWATVTIPPLQREATDGEILRHLVGTSPGASNDAWTPDWSW